MSRPPVRRCVLRAAACAALLAGCAIPTDNAPRDISDRDRADPVADNAATGAEGGKARVYLLVTEEGRGPVLVPVSRDVDENSRALITALLQGPTSAELAAQLRTALTSEVSLLSTRLDSGTLTLDFTRELAELSGNTLINALAQIVWTASQLDGVEALRILVEGNATAWPALSGELQSDLLTVFDYQGIVRTSQPAFPAVPTPQQPSS
jgi:spore germination protein GerM